MLMDLELTVKRDLFSQHSDRRHGLSAFLVLAVIPTYRLWLTSTVKGPPPYRPLWPESRISRLTVDGPASFPNPSESKPHSASAWPQTADLKEEKADS